LVAALLFCAVPNVKAASPEDLYFYGINDDIDVSLGYSQPVTKDSLLYVPMRLFTDNFAVTYSYDAVSNVLTMAHKERKLFFNNNYGFAIDQDNVLHFITYFIQGTAFFVPFYETASLLGFRCAYYSSIQTLRIYESSQQLSAVDYIARHSFLVTQTINSYYSKNLYLTFEGPLDENVLTILQTLKSYSLDAVFFISEDDMRNSPDMVRAIVTRGFEIGFIMPMSPADAMADPETFMQKLNDMNKLLSVVAKTKTRLMRHYFSSSTRLSGDLKNGLSDGGWRLWGHNYASTATSAQAIYSYLYSRLAYRQTATILTIYVNPAASEVVRRLYSYAQDNNFFFSGITETTSPLNSLL